MNDPQVDPGRPKADQMTAAGTAPTAAAPEDGSVFIADLAKAMQATAGAQRLRIAEHANERRQAHIDSIRGRESTQSDELRELAERDVKGIEAWATAEIERVRLERQRRISARKAELERRLEQHHTLIEREVAAVEAAVAGYRSDVDGFFARLDAEKDPVAIAREAGNLPPFPDLEIIGPDDAPGGVPPVQSPFAAQTRPTSSFNAVSYHIPSTAPVDAAPVVADPVSTNGSVEAVSEEAPATPAADEIAPTASASDTGSSDEPVGPSGAGIAAAAATSAAVAAVADQPEAPEAPEAGSETVSDAQAAEAEEAAAKEAAAITAAAVAEPVADAPATIETAPAAIEVAPEPEPVMASVDADESLSALVEGPAATEEAKETIAVAQESIPDAPAITEAAIAEAAAEPEPEPVVAAAPLVGVMDQEPVTAAEVPPWEKPVEQPALAVVEPAAQPERPYAPMSEEDLIGDTDPAAVPAGVGKIAPRSSGAVIQSVPSLRPIGSWLRRSNHSS